MKIQRQFEVASREATQIRTMIHDLNRIIQLLDCDIAIYEEKAPVRDPANFAYPIAARTMAARRDNLRTTIALLEDRLANINAMRPEEVAIAA
jgi:hypothetical protein